MSSAFLIYPHQLWRFPRPSLSTVYLIEDPLFFRQYNFHAQKILLHRASMKHYAHSLEDEGFKVRYVECRELTNSSSIGEILTQERIGSVSLYELDDDWLSQRLGRGLRLAGINFNFIASPGFLTPIEKSKEFFSSQKRNYFTEFYVWQRKRLGILLEDKKPLGGKWSFDHENRRKLPKSVSIPCLPPVKEDIFTQEAREYLKANFPNAPGNHISLIYPHTHEVAQEWLEDFVANRFALFGDYEDAISCAHGTLFHSVLTPSLNIGLITPQQILEAALSCRNVSINSLEGFIRQVIGWREYMRAMYALHGSTLRSGNFFNSTREMPQSFYDGTTGILPFDTVIKRTLATGYCHHIERLMVLGSFMLLCQIEPHAIYKWFMEMFIDSYDWVMVPNVYAMSQFADGGGMTTKPYVSGSNYLLKMSDYSKGPWCAIWDALYWNHIYRHQEFYASNHRMSIMAAQCSRMGEKLLAHKQMAANFLDKLR